MPGRHSGIEASRAAGPRDAPRPSDSRRMRGCSVGREREAALEVLGHAKAGAAAAVRATLPAASSGSPWRRRLSDHTAAVVRMAVAAS